MAEEIQETWLADFPWVRLRFIEQGGTAVDACAIELARFFNLTRATDKPLAMISSRIDLLWHTFIQFTESYTRFCESAFGEVIHHRSRTQFSPVPDEAIRNFFTAYESRYGSVPEIWLDDAPAELVAFGRGDSEHIPVALAWSGCPGRSGAEL